MKNCISFCAFWILNALCSSLFGQVFTLDNQYNKMKGKYPFIEKYLPSDSGLVKLFDCRYEQCSEFMDDESAYLTFDYFSKQEPYDSTNYSPCIVFIHGGGWSSGTKEMDHPMAIAMALRGFNCICVDYRKSGIAKYPAAITDVCMALRAVRGTVLPHCSRICLVGSSAGGQMAALIGCNDNPILSDSSLKNSNVHVDRVIDIDGVLAFIHPDSAEGRDKPNRPSAATQWFGVPMQADSALWNDASPLYHVNSQSADYTFIVGTQKRFTAGINEMCIALQREGHNAQVVRIFADNCQYDTNIDVPETETPHCFWLFSPWAQKVVDAMYVALADWVVN